MATDIRAQLKFAETSAQKARLVVDLVRGKPVVEASNILRFTPKKAARIINKVLDSAIANAEENFWREPRPTFTSMKLPPMKDPRASGAVLVHVDASSRFCAALRTSRLSCASGSSKDQEQIWDAKLIPLVFVSL